MVQTIQKLKKKYQGEWLAVKVLEEKEGRVTKGELIAHHRDRRELHRILRKKKIKKAYIFFSGPIVKPGYSIILIID
jgi:hypothetical protein